MNLRDAAINYEAKETKNIADLQMVSVDCVILNKVVEGERPEDTFAYDYIVVEGTEYRVPKQVISGLQIVLKEKPNLENFKVVKSGTGKFGTKYTVIPL